MKKVLILGLLACGFITATGTKTGGTQTGNSPTCQFGVDPHDHSHALKCHNLSEDEKDLMIELNGGRAKCDESTKCIWDSDKGDLYMWGLAKTSF